MAQWAGNPNFCSSKQVVQHPGGVAGLYPSVQFMKDLLDKEYAAAADPEQVRNLSLQLAEQTIMLLVGRAVVFALAKQVNKDWNSEAIKLALSPESLSLAADDFTDALQSARRKIGIALRTTGRQTDRVAEFPNRSRAVAS